MTEQPCTNQWNEALRDIWRCMWKWWIIQLRAVISWSYREITLSGIQKFSRLNRAGFHQINSSQSIMKLNKSQSFSDSSGRRRRPDTKRGQKKWTSFRPPEGEVSWPGEVPEISTECGGRALDDGVHALLLCTTEVEADQFVLVDLMEKDPKPALQDRYRRHWTSDVKNWRKSYTHSFKFNMRCSYS